MKRRTDINDISFGVIRARMRLHFSLIPKGDRQAVKIFVIGHPRCGTTTLHKLFIANGLDSFHNSADWPVARYDAFSDFGQLRPIAAYDRTYPNAKFILNFRPLRPYLISISTHHQRIFNAQNFVNEIHRRADYFAWALRYFNGRDDFIAVNIEAPKALPTVAEFCGFDVAEPPGGAVHNASSRIKSEANLQNIETALAALGLGDEAGRGCLVSKLHGADCDTLIKARDSIRFVE
ncbi:hypothetical protein MNBD_ALPHA07-352 [hydrothermal vent metagenome]|uniref:Sulfotransferase domain-containing protein n=1 Tax=hydrothermal vent metagenome TaxID=652676 RepID=A0A3B0RWT7_9ZZZZ